MVEAAPMLRDGLEFSPPKVTDRISTFGASWQNPDARCRRGVLSLGEDRSHRW
jgi:hypothetical protein